MSNSLQERKVALLKERKDYRGTQESQGGVVIVNFTGGTYCTVNQFGRVEWHDRGQA